jgi:hypothetical protein
MNCLLYGVLALQVCTTIVCGFAIRSSPSTGSYLLHVLQEVSAIAASQGSINSSPYKGIPNGSDSS